MEILDIFKDKEILEYYGVNRERKITKQEQRKYLEIKKNIEKLIDTKIEKIYLMDGLVYFVIDKRYKDLEEDYRKIKEFMQESFMLTSLCIFEKRKNMPTERIYFVSRFGIKVFDSEKEPSIDESIKSTRYATENRFLQEDKRYLHSPHLLMGRLIRIYILKLGYPVNIDKYDFNVECKIAKQISKDKKGLELIDQFNEENDENKKMEIVKDFEKHIEKIKQVKYIPKLKNKPTMQIYEKILKEKEEKGKLDIKDLNKEDLYIMYVIQGKQTYELCDLYDVPRTKIDSKRTYYKIKSSETIMKPELIKKNIDIANQQLIKKYVYAILKDELFDFEKSIMPILEYMKDGDTYLLKEFWRFVTKEENLITKALKNHVTDSYYKADLCVDLLLQNDLIKEVDYKQYKITKKGKKLLMNVKEYTYEKEITIPVLAKFLDDFRYFDLEFKYGYPKDKKEIEEIQQRLKTIAYNEWNNYSQKEHPEMLEKIEFIGIEDEYKGYSWIKKDLKNNKAKDMKNQLEISATAKKLVENREDKNKVIAIWMLAYLNTLIKDKNMAKNIKNIEELEDLRFVLKEEVREGVFELMLPENIFTKEIFKYIYNPEISDIIKLAVTNCSYIKENYEIIEIKVEV